MKRAKSGIQLDRKKYNSTSGTAKGAGSSASGLSSSATSNNVSSKIYSNNNNIVNSMENNKSRLDKF